MLIDRVLAGCIGIAAAARVSAADLASRNLHPDFSHEAYYGVEPEPIAGVPAPAPEMIEGCFSHRIDRRPYIPPVFPLDIRSNESFRGFPGSSIPRV